MEGGGRGCSELQLLISDLFSKNHRQEFCKEDPALEEHMLWAFGLKLLFRGVLGGRVVLTSVVAKLLNLKPSKPINIINVLNARPLQLRCP